MWTPPITYSCASILDSRHGLNCGAVAETKAYMKMRLGLHLLTRVTQQTG